MALAGKTAFITGATRGIGRQLALAFADQGATVAITGKTAEPTPGLDGTIHTVAAEVEERGVRPVFSALASANSQTRAA